MEMLARVGLHPENQHSLKERRKRLHCFGLELIQMMTELMESGRMNPVLPAVQTQEW